MGEVLAFAPARMRRVRERISRIRERYAAEPAGDRLAEIEARLRTIDNAVAGLQFNRRAVMAEWRAECRRLQAAERRRQESGE